MVSILRTTRDVPSFYDKQQMQRLHIAAVFGRRLALPLSVGVAAGRRSNTLGFTRHVKITRTIQSRAPPGTMGQLSGLATRSSKPNTCSLRCLPSKTQHMCVMSRQRSHCRRCYPVPSRYSFATMPYFFASR